MPEDDDLSPSDGALVASCVWRIEPAVVGALDAALGDPVDAYVNGSQVWLDDDGPGGITVEFRLHPVASFVKPKGVPTSELFQHAVAGQVDPAALWDGLEAFPAHDDPVSAEALQTWCGQRIGLEPDAAGLVDHEVIAEAWERSERATSIVADLLAQLSR